MDSAKDSRKYWGRLEVHCWRGNSAWFLYKCPVANLPLIPDTRKPHNLQCCDTEPRSCWQVDRGVAMVRNALCKSAKGKGSGLFCEKAAFKLLFTRCSLYLSMNCFKELNHELQLLRWNCSADKVFVTVGFSETAGLSSDDKKKKVCFTLMLIQTHLQTRG